MDERTALLYARTHEFQYLVTKTERFISWALKQVNTPYVACSFGKDSAVMLHLVLKQLPEVQVIFVKRIETDLVDNYAEVIQAWKDQYNINLQSISYRGWLEENPDGKGIASATKGLEGYDSFFVGLRSDESVGRRITLHKDGKFFKMKSGKVRLCPLAWWNTNQIATYIIHNKLPLLNKYKEDGFEARTTAAIPSKFPHESIQSLKSRDIASYNSLLQLLPDAKYFT